jgi:hypothetical protein
MLLLQTPPAHSERSQGRERGRSIPFASVGAVPRHVRSRGVNRKSRNQEQTGAITRNGLRQANAPIADDLYNAHRRALPTQGTPMTIEKRF